MENDVRVPKLAIKSFGYMYLAASEDFAKNSEVIRKFVAAGAATELLTRMKLNQGTLSIMLRI